MDWDEYSNTAIKVKNAIIVDIKISAIWKEIFAPTLRYNQNFKAKCQRSAIRYPMLILWKIKSIQSLSSWYMYSLLRCTDSCDWCFLGITFVYGWLVVVNYVWILACIVFRFVSSLLYEYNNYDITIFLGLFDQIWGLLKHHWVLKAFLWPK